MITRAKQAALDAVASRHPQAAEAFKEGLGSVLRQWTALELAVFHQWGGPNSKERADALHKELFELFIGPDKVYKDDVSLILEDYLETEFNTVCEDGSPDELGELFCTMWRKCCEGDFTLVTDVLAKEYVRHEMVSRSQGLQGGDADSDDDGGADENNTAEIMEAEMQNNETMEEAMDEPAPPLVDPDGWETVTRQKKKKQKGYKI